MASDAERVRVMVFTQFFLPGYRAGGPIRTLANLVCALGNEFDLRIVTLDRDLGDELPYQTVVADRWSEMKGTPVLYLRRPSVTVRRLVEEVRRVQPAVIYLNSCLDRVFTFRILVARRCGVLGRTSVVLAPRGEFSPGALTLKKTIKALFLGACRFSGLYRGVTFHASSLHEARDIRAAIGAGRPAIAIAPNIVRGSAEQVADQGETSDQSPGVLRVCFLARVSPMKNLEFALRVLAQVRSRVEFNIHGPISDRQYWSLCQARLATLPPNAAVRYLGDVPASRVIATLRTHDLFLLPTLGENFGHVIHEALCAGLPVLISDRTPWAGLEDAGAGWALPLGDPGAFARVIEQVAAMSVDQRRVLAANARTYAKRAAESNDAVQLTRQMLIDAAAAFPAP